MKRLLDPSFRYTPSHATDVRKTFARIRAEQAVAGAGGSTNLVRWPSAGVAGVNPAAAAGTRRR